MSVSYRYIHRDKFIALALKASMADFFCMVARHLDYKLNILLFQNGKLHGCKSQG